jgi:hypothetical protein
MPVHSVNRFDVFYFTFESTLVYAHVFNKRMRD